MKPLADLVRPTELDEVCGQEHILGKNKILDRIIKSGHISNMIFYGPPGTGKTTVANIIAKKAGKRFYKLNATNASLTVNDLSSSFSSISTSNLLDLPLSMTFAKMIVTAILHTDPMTAGSSAPINFAVRYCGIKNETPDINVINKISL